MTTAVNATEPELRAVAEALKLAAILDDRAPGPDKPRITAWGEQIHRHRLTREDLLDAVQAFYDQPSAHAIGVGDLIAHARRIKITRLDKQADAERDRQRALFDTKAADEVTSAGNPLPGMSHVAGMGPPRVQTPRLVAAREALQTCYGATDSRAAIREYLAALVQARHAPAQPDSGRPTP